MQAIGLLSYRASQSEAKGDFSRLKMFKARRQAITTHHTRTTGLMFTIVECRMTSSWNSDELTLFHALARGGLTRILTFVITEGRWADKQQRQQQPIPTCDSQEQHIRIPYRSHGIVKASFLQTVWIRSVHPTSFAARSDLQKAQ